MPTRLFFHEVDGAEHIKLMTRVHPGKTQRSLMNPEKVNNKVRGDRWRPAKNPPMAKLVPLWFFVKENERKFLNGYLLRRSVLL